MTFRISPRRRVNVERRLSGADEGVLWSDLETTVTPQSINVYLPYVEQGATVGQTASLEYRVTGGDPTWIAWLPMDKTTSSVWGGRLIGSVMLLTPATGYDLRVTASATGGAHVVTTTATTAAADTLESHASLLARATHYVRLDGSDTNTGVNDNGTAPTGAWRTVRKAHQSAPTGAVVVVGSGTADEYFEWSGATVTTPLRSSLGGVTFVARFPAIDDDKATINVGKRTFVEGHIRAAPTGVVLADHVTAPWVSTELTGPVTGDTITVWKWSGAKSVDDRLNAMLYGSTRTEEMRHMWQWDWQVVTDWTPEYWADFAADDVDRVGGTKLNIMWHWGYFYVTNSTDIYLLMPPDAAGLPQDPNDFYWTVHGGDGFNLACPDSRVTGFVIRGGHNGVSGNQRSDRLTVDHNWIQSYSGVRTNGRVASLVPSYSSDIVVRDNLITARGTRRDPSLTQAQDMVAPWGAIKQHFFLTARGIASLPAALQVTQSGGPNNGKVYYGTANPRTRNRLLGRMEGTGMLNSGSRRTRFFDNTVRGVFNGFGAEVTLGTTQFTEDMFSNAESECYGNLFQWCADDAWEPAHACPNVKFWDNRVEYCISGMSTGGPTAWGPMYMVRNVFWRVSCSTGFGMQPMEDAANSLLRGDQNAYWFKYDGAASAQRPQARFYVISNTFWSDDTRAHGGEPAAGQGSLGQKIYKRNNIERVAIDFMDFFGPARGGYDADYNAYAAANTAARFRRNPSNASEATVVHASFAAYVTATGFDTHSNTVGMGFANEFDVTTMDAQFTSPTTGVLTLTGGSTLIGVGVNTPLTPSGAVDLGYQP